MEALDRDKRERLILASLMERRVAVEEESRRLRNELQEMGKREAELRTEILALDQILGALPQPPKENEAPSLFVRAPPPAHPPAAPARKRRRKGSRREQMIPRLRAKFGSGAFTTEDVTDVILADEPGERRKAYFAAWSLCRDLGEDGVTVVVSEEGTGKRTKRTYRFAPEAEKAP
jgi:hypothetical protein